MLFRSDASCFSSNWRIRWRTLPLGNERWLQTERELVAAEQALDRLRINQAFSAP